MITVFRICTWDEVAASNHISRISRVRPEGLRDKVLDVSDEVLTEVNSLHLKVVHRITSYARNSGTLQVLRSQAIDSLMLTADRVTCYSGQRIVTEEN